VLLSGDHARIEEFRAREAWKKTAKNRPLLLGLCGKGADEDG